MGKFRDLASIRGRRVWLIRAAEIGAIGAGGSARLALRWLAQSGASTIIQIGMAFGVDPGAQQVGDVLVARSLFPYDIRTVREAQPGIVSVDYTGQHFEASAEFLFHLEELRDTSTSDASLVAAHRGVILTGNSKVFSVTHRDELVRAASRATMRVVGGEMEGLGLLAASSPNTPNWNIVKGISDFADGQDIDPSERDRHRTMACENAVALVFDVLERYPEHPAEIS
jgi:nucleoside phosphorylase